MVALGFGVELKNDLIFKFALELPPFRQLDEVASRKTRAMSQFGHARSPPRGNGLGFREHRENQSQFLARKSLQSPQAARVLTKNWRIM